MFKSLDQAQLEVMVGAMTSVHVQSGDQVIRQGDAGDLFYVVDSGEFEVYVASAGASDTKVMDVMNGGSFGELALMYGSPRAATVRAVSDGRLWALDRTTFRCVADALPPFQPVGKSSPTHVVVIGCQGPVAVAW
jgi:cAMP-dependent protein kinase regulator